VLKEEDFLIDRNISQEIKNEEKIPGNNIPIGLKSIVKKKRCNYLSTNQQAIVFL